jgi:polyphosphate glucokinase
VAIGYPGRAGVDGPVDEPGSLGHGRVGYQFSSVFNRPTRIVNDAVLQALGA